ncbi:MAG TPA: hypothetical protein PK006_11495 [Saprospiraceae bacterium]|nr:hypothetical protein [Saprospiraceae bacterium]
MRVWAIELAWWLVAALFALLMVLPILQYNIPYPFLITHITYVAGFVLYLKLLFLWKKSPYSKYQWLKLILIFAMIPVVFFSIEALANFQNYLDEIGIQEMVKDLDESLQDGMALYIRTQMIFFGTACIICGIVLAPKMIWSIWTQHNRGYA